MAKEKEIAQQTGKKWVDFEDLTLCNNFMFGEVVADEKAGKDILEVILGKEIEKIVVYEKEKNLDNVPGQRGVRFDVYLKDQADTIYNLEMQVAYKTDMPKRSRYYQGILDTKILPSGCRNYNVLNQSIIIFICKFDPFGGGRCVYTFEPRCVEEPELALKDGTRRIFLNTKGKNKKDLPKALAELLDYLEDPDTILEEPRIIELDDRLKKIKKEKEARDQYMTLQNLIEEEREEAHASGVAEGHISLIRKKYNKGYDVAQTADMLEQETAYVERIYSLLEDYPESTDAEIAEMLSGRA